MSRDREREDGDDLLPFGVIGKPFGKQGEVMFRPYNHAAGWPPGLTTAWLARAGKRHERRVLGARAVPGGTALRFEGIDTRALAQSLTLAEVEVLRSALPALAPGEFYLHDLVGCAVFADDGRELGHVVGLFWNGAHDVATVRDAAGRETLVPMVPAHIAAFDAARRVLTVDWSEDETP